MEEKKWKHNHDTCNPIRVCAQRFCGADPGAGSEAYVSGVRVSPSDTLRESFLSFHLLTALFPNKCFAKATVGIEENIMM